MLAAYDGLFAPFECEDCEVPFRVVEERKETSDFRCECGKVNWNLKRKG